MYSFDFLEILLLLFLLIGAIHGFLAYRRSKNLQRDVDALSGRLKALVEQYSANLSSTTEASDTLAPSDPTLSQTTAPAFLGYPSCINVLVRQPRR